MKAALIITATVVVFLSASLSWAHGTRGDAEEGIGIRVVAEYDDGDPMSYGNVEVISPDGGVVFQTGRTDRNGVFMFAPDQPGKWRITISDEMGHRLVLGRQIDMEKGGKIEAATSRGTTAPGVSRREGIVAGVSIIFGLFSLFYGWKARLVSRKPTLTQE